MKAIVCRELGKPLVVKDVRTPSPTASEVLVRIKCSGVCHSDVHLWKGDWPSAIPEQKKFGVTIGGHEGIGEVVEVGSNVRLVKSGDRVGIPLMNYVDQTCEPCLTGRETWCENAKYTSIHVNGTFAEYSIVSERYAVPVPREIEDVEAAPLLCAGVTAYGGITKLIRDNVRPGKTIAVIGAAGGLGHYGTQIANAFGYKVIGIDKGESRLKFVSELGASFAVDAADAEKFVKEKFGGVTAVVCFSPTIAGYELAFRLVRMAGLVVAVGEPAVREGNLPIVPSYLIDNGIRVLPTAVGSPLELRELFSIYVDRKLKSFVTEVASPGQINDVFQRIENEQIKGRAVIKL